MNVAGFVLLAVLLAAYAVLDGYDLGTGVLHLFFLRTREQRAASFEMIGPYWSGNEVLLIATGAALFALFPHVYAAAFSGFYLAFMVVLWLLMVRGMSIELRGHFSSDLWRDFWDAAFALSSALLAFVFGLCIGNVIRGVPIDAAGYFAGSFGLLLNQYSLSVALFTLFVLALHGAAFAAWRLDGPLHERAVAARSLLWCFATALFAFVTAQTFFTGRVHGGAAMWAFALISVAALAGVRYMRSGIACFTCSSIFVASLAGTAAATLFPFLLPSFPAGPGGLSIYNGGGNAVSLTTGVTAGVIGVAAAAVYGTLAARRMLRRVQS